MRAAAIVAGMILCLIAQSSWATKLSGKVIVTAKMRTELSKIERDKGESHREYYWNEPNGIIPVKPPVVDPSKDIAVVIFKEGASDPGPDELFTVKVHAGSLEQNVIVTRPGSTLRFLNVDPFDHELYSPKLIGFKPERQSNGAFRPIQFSQEGVFAVQCKLMPHFSGHVVVTKATYIAEVRKDGTFATGDLKPGNYTAKVFFDGKWIYKRSFKIEGEREMKLEIKLSSTGSAKAKSKG